MQDGVFLQAKYILEAKPQGTHKNWGKQFWSIILTFYGLLRTQSAF